MRWYLAGSGILGGLGVLAGCAGGGWFAERETWRHEAEVQCLTGGAVKETANVVRIQAIQGPGMCGADFPLKVSMLGESAILGYTEEVRPPGTIPNASQQPRWPVAPRAEPNNQGNGPVSLSPPGTAAPTSTAPNQPTYYEYDYRKPYGAAPARTSPQAPPPLAPPPRSSNVREPPPGSLDMSPVPYDRRRAIDTQHPSPMRTGTLAPGSRGAIRAEPLPDAGARMPVQSAPIEVRAREPQSLPALGPSRGTQIAIATPVAVNPPATLACPMVSELDRWIANSVQPAAMRWFGSPVAEIKQISAYSCRGMNGNSNARISEHAFGNALDIASFTLADGRKITVKNGWRGLPEEQGFLRDVQGAACDQFTTVLAPGSNAYHYDHIHVDLMRRNGRACNPQAVSGEEVAVRAGGPRYAVRRGDVTGSLEQRRPAPVRAWRNSDERRDRALPMAEPGNDGQD